MEIDWQEQPLIQLTIATQYFQWIIKIPDDMYVPTILSLAHISIKCWLWPECDLQDNLTLDTNRTCFIESPPELSSSSLPFDEFSVRTLNLSPSLFAWPVDTFFQLRLSVLLLWTHWPAAGKGTLRAPRTRNKWTFPGQYLNKFTTMHSRHNSLLDGLSGSKVTNSWVHVRVFALPTF